jgi:hypothetical protein
VLLHTLCGGKQKVPVETKYRSACDHSGKSGKQIERCLISTFIGGGDASTLDILFVGIDLFEPCFLNHMRFSQASLWFVFTKSSSAFETTLRNRPASAGTIDTIASTTSFGSR